jgi:hypothetical protein
MGNHSSSNDARSSLEASLAQATVNYHILSAAIRRLERESTNELIGAARKTLREIALRNLAGALMRFGSTEDSSEGTLGHSARWVKRLEVEAAADAAAAEGETAAVAAARDLLARSPVSPPPDAVSLSHSLIMSAAASMVADLEKTPFPVHASFASSKTLFFLP